MRVAHVLAQDPTRFRGGTEVIVLAQARALADLGHDVRVVAPTRGFDEAGAALLAADGVELVDLAPRTDADPSVFVDERARDAVIAATRDADVVHVHHWYGSSLDVVRRLAVERVTVLHLHDAFSTCGRTFRAPRADVACPPGVELEACTRCITPDFPALGADGVRLLLEERRELLRAEFAAADAVVAPSRFLAELVAGSLGVPTPRVVPHGLARAATFVERAPEPTGPLRVLHAGNRATVKGCLDLATAAGALPAGSVKFVFHGREVEAGLDAEIARLGGENVELRGRFDARDWPTLAADHDLCALPSRAAEGYGLVAEEALAHGLPTWVSDRGALPERVAAAARVHRFAGRVLPVGDADAWREALLELVESRAMLQDARRLLPREFRDARAGALELEALDRTLLAADPRRTLRSA